MSTTDQTNQPASATDEPIVYGVVQEGGSSTELYLHVLDTEAEADAYRISCRDEGSYRTGPPVPLSASLVDHPEFFSAVGALLRATLDIDYPD